MRVPAKLDPQILLEAAARAGFAKPATSEIARSAGLCEAVVREVMAGRLDRVSRRSASRVLAVLELSVEDVPTT